GGAADHSFSARATPRSRLPAGYPALRSRRGYSDAHSGRETSYSVRPAPRTRFHRPPRWRQPGKRRWVPERSWRIAHQHLHDLLIVELALGWRELAADIDDIGDREGLQSPDDLLHLDDRVLGRLRQGHVFRESAAELRACHVEIG